MVSGFVQYGPSRIHYRYAGSGKTVIIALHGYGRSAESFSFLTRHLGSAYQLLAIDLPFHGYTAWESPGRFRAADLAAIIDAISVERGIPVDRFILLGFSMGGKIALALAEHDHSRVLKLVLIAPDGIQVNFWYWLATQTWAGYHLFRATMQHPGWLLRLLEAARRYRIAADSVITFAAYYLQDNETRMELLNRWTALSKCGPHRSRLAAIIRKHQLPVRLLFGRYDPIIRPNASRYLCKDGEAWCQVIIEEAGHHLLNERHAQVITRLITT